MRETMVILRKCLSAFLLVLLAVSVTPIAPATAAGADAADGWREWYVGLSVATQSRKRSAETATAVDFDRGNAINGALGYRFRNGLRLEAEFSNFENDIDQFVFPGGSEPATGQIELRAWLINLYYDIRTRNPRLKPYVGVGVGRYKSYIQGFTSNLLSSGVPGAFDPIVLNVTSPQTDVVQYRVGVSYVVSERTEIFLAYRYFDGDRLEFVFLPPPRSFGTLRPTGAKTRNWEIGFRVGF